MEVFIIAAITLDGYIGRTASDRSFDWTTAEDKAEYISKIKESKHLVMGNTTLRIVKRFPVDTTVYAYTRQPEQFSAEGLSHAATYQPTFEKPSELVERLTASGVQQLAICGGASIYQQFLVAGVVNKLYLTIEPVLFGRGIKLFGESMENRLQLVESRVLNSHGSVWLEYDVLPAGELQNTSNDLLEKTLYES